MTPEENAAHLARLGYMRVMGCEHYSVTDPEYIVKRFRAMVRDEAFEEAAKVAESACHMIGCIQGGIHCGSHGAAYKIREKAKGL